jgi:ribosomal-protein-alanine N-acetyltransferase
MPHSIRSARLDLIPLTPEFLRASLAGDLPLAGRLVGLSLPEDWMNDDPPLALRLRQLDEDPSLQPWLLRAIGLRDRGVMVGHIGFHTRPGADYLVELSPGGVEFGYTVFPAFRRRGFAREASEALMAWAAEAHRVSRFVVSISPNNIASQSLAAQLGFRRIGSHMDEVDGYEEIFERTLPPL